MSEELKSGDRIGAFTVLHHCGKGAFGQVYLVRDDDGRTRALKVLSADRRGERELEGLLRFQKVAHPDLLRIDRISTLPDGRIFYTMDPADNAATPPDYVPDTLARRMRERGALPPDELKTIMIELASGLAELHRAHLCHRDIKPENILFVNGHATIADAGAVGEAGGSTLVGTPEYMHPDVCLQKRRFAASDDCYALGKVLYSALTNEEPRKFPSTPRTLASPEEVALFKAAERACTPPGVSAYKFLELLKHPEQTAPSRKGRRIAFAAAAAAVAVMVILCMALAAAALYPKTSKPIPDDPGRSERPVAVKPPQAPVPAPTPKGKPQTAAAKPPRSPAVPAPKTAEPTLEELLKKYERSADEQRIVDRWLAEYAVWVRRINQAGLSGNKTRVAELIAEMKKKLPYGIADFCGGEIGIKKLLAAVSRDRNRLDSRRLELLLQYRRDELKKLLDRLPPEELAKWR